ncbi:EamA family transporter [Neobacillus ginsengisoli]|uniref:Drug/metabolite transporter (DMT)-like permease n=1 Tax=Neobacillus ginsengisoli TaxID=904295 RepID=A0ABT9Y2V1_9BACI|nr:DMT family transporter [Neobacillus ginsengisoli]MDQ0202046.1 drug/metabolite transporter (DMT)-like permease [Neobacillus ginsengisoli]
MKFWQHIFLVFLGGCCYGVLSTFVKLAYSAGFTTAEVTGVQFIFGSILIWSVALVTKKQRLTVNKTFKILLSGIPLGLTGVFYYYSLQTLHASLAIVFLFQFVWMGTFLEWIIYKNKPSKGKVVTIVILIIGSILAAGLILKGEKLPPWQGTIWGIISALSYTIFIFLSSSVEKDTPPILKSALLSTGGLFVVMSIFPPFYIFKLPVLIGLSPYGLFLGLFGVALPPLLFSIGMPFIGPGLGTILTSSELPVAVTLSAFILGEHITIYQWLGVILIFCGIVIGNCKTQKGKRQIVKNGT